MHNRTRVPPCRGRRRLRPGVQPAARPGFHYTGRVSLDAGHRRVRPGSPEGGGRVEEGERLLAHLEQHPGELVLQAPVPLRGHRHRDRQQRPGAAADGDGRRADSGRGLLAVVGDPGLPHLVEHAQHGHRGRSRSCSVSRSSRAGSIRAATSGG